ncbi:MAG: extracellular solute-binding protein [Acidisphaera sp.]|nr:extracellular solute-binding protein [Acidisphaera sp.]MBV9812615.1 extracellular solute-binding protein [Acetobacteraceae bacterium]
MRAMRRVLTLTAAAMLCGAMSAAAKAETKTLVEWDFKSSEPLMKPYFDFVKKTFEKAHPGVQVRQVAQPEDSYYTVLGTAINGKHGPDVALIHGGGYAMDRAAAFLPLKAQVGDMIPDLTGLPNFQRPDGTYIALPLTAQGVVLYYSDEVYKAAGLDPKKPPQTWDDLAANCRAIKQNTHAACFALGNKNGVDGFNMMAAFALGMWSQQTRDAFLAHKLSWTSPDMRAVFARLKQAIDEGWIAPGANSYSPYTDVVNTFAGGRAGHITGLISDAPNAWKNLEELVGAGNLGIALPVIIDPQNVNAETKRLEVDGGIGFGVTSWTANPDLAIDYVKTAVSPAAAAVLMQSAGGLPANSKVDVAQLSSPAAKQIIDLLKCCSTDKRLRSFLSDAERVEFTRVSQLLLTGDISIDDALQSLERVRQADLARAR